MTIQIGERLPDASFMTMGENGPEPLTSDQVFRGKTVALFAVPGAFTPTCSAKHLPGFIDQGEALRAKGIDTIACTSVNDVFVMGAWADASGVDGDILMLADGNGDFAKDIGLELDGRSFAMGARSQRYALVAKDGVVTHLFVEEPGEFKASSAEHLLEVL